MTDLPFEAIVIGSGATGGVAALTLSEKGIKVLVIEAGPLLTAKEAAGSEPSNTIKRIQGVITGEKVKQAQHPGYWKANPLLYTNERVNPYTCPSNKPFIWTQGNQVGGRSLTWGGITLRLSDKEFKAAKEDGYGLDWPIQYSDINSHYSAIEKFLQVHGKKDNLSQLPDGEYLNPLPLTKSEITFSRKLKRSLGYPLINSRGFGPPEFNGPGLWPISSSMGSTLKKAFDTGKVELLSNHMADYLVIDKAKELAKGVVVVNQNDGSRILLESNLIVLCASTIQSIRLLLNSEESHRKGGFIDPSNSLGKNIMDHVSTCRFFSYPTGHNQRGYNNDSSKESLSGAGSFFIPFGTNLKTSIKPDFIRGYGIWGGIDRFEPPNILKRLPDRKLGFLIAHGEVLAYVDNKVTLSNKLNRWGIAVPNIDVEWKDNEKRMVKHMNTTIQEIIENTGGEMLPLKDLIKMPFIEPIINNAVAIKEESPPPGYYIHELGGAPMGKSEENSVVDKWNRLWRCKNVLVVDGACWPSSAWQSPTLTMMALTRRACLNAITNQSA